MKGADIKITPELLGYRIIMGMIHLRLGHIGDGISLEQHSTHGAGILGKEVLFAKITHLFQR
jgi:hypothetical protein